MERASIPLLIGAVALMMTASVSLAQNQRDLTDAQLAELLGVQPEFEDYLHEVQVEMGGRGPTAPRPEQVFVGHAGADRYVLKITFPDEFCEDDSVFHFYADIDNDPETGRQDSEAFRGTDMMYSFVNARNDPRFMNPAVRVSHHIPVRGVVRGNAIYVSDDINVNVRNGETDFRIRILSHLRSNNRDSFSCGWTQVSIPLDETRTPPRLPIPEPRGFAMLTMPNFAELAYRVWQDEGTVRLRPQDADVSGFYAVMNDDFDGVGAEGERVVWQSPVAGSYHVGLVMQASPERLQQTRRMPAARERDAAPERRAGGVAALDLLVGGEPVGTTVAHPRATGEVLHYTIAPVQLHEGTPIEVRSAEHSGSVVFHSVHLSRRPPGVPPLRIENLAAWHVPDAPGEARGRIMVAWTTNRPTEAHVRVRSVAGPEAEAQLDGRGRVNNHYVILPPALAGDAWELDITCREADQDDFEAQEVTTQFTVHRDRAAHLRAHDMEAPVDPRAVSIPLRVHEPTGSGRTAWPVRSGVPLPPALLQDPGAVRLLDADGAEVALQTRALSWWPDGLNVQWLLVDFMADTSAGDEAAYTLEVNAQPARAEAGITLEANRRDTEPDAPLGLVDLPLRVNTGPLNLVLEAGGFAPFVNVTVNGRAVSGAAPRTGGFEIADRHGVVYSSALAPPEQVIIEEEGPLRATVLVRGKLTSQDGGEFMRYLCRLHFHAGKPYVRTVFTLENDVIEPDMNLFSAVQVRVPAALAGARFSYGADGAAHALDAGGRLLQDDDFRFTAGEHEGRRADGWLLAQGDARSLAVAVRDFWQLYPKGFRADDTGVVLELHPALPADQYAGADDDALTQWYFWCDEGRYKIRTGVRLSTEFAVDWDPGMTDEAPAAYVAGEWWSRPLFAACTPQWYCDTGVLDTLIPRQEGMFEIYDHRLDAAFERFRARQEREREYGFMNYGDWFGERTWNWGNVEYDTQWALAANFLRTGNLPMLHHAVAAAAHNADIDTIHHHRDPNRVGFVYTHCTGHTAGYFPRDWKNMGGFNTHSGDRGGHIWSQGQYAAYALTGEERLLESAEKITDMLARYTTDFRYGAERTVGWPMVATMAGYGLTANPFYLNAARLMADIVVWGQHPERGLWGHWIDPNECDHAPRCWGSKPFMTGVLLRGMKMYHLARPRDDVLRSMLHNVDFLFREAYVHEGDRPGFVYSGCRHERFSGTGSVSRLSLIGPGVAYAVRLDPERRRLPMLEHAARLYFERAGISDFGKSFTQGTCFIPTVMHDLAQLGITDFPAPPAHGQMEVVPPTVPLAPGETARGRVVLRAPRDAGARGTVTLVTDERWEIEPARLELVAAPGKRAQAEFQVTARRIPRQPALSVSLLRAVFEGAPGRIEATAGLRVPDGPLEGVPLVQAAAFVEQTGGEVQVRPAQEKVGAVGDSISHWDDGGHALTWELTAPAAGELLLALRYCAVHEATRRIQVADQPPVEQVFPATGGFASHTDDWQHAVVIGRAGQPLTLRMERGEVVRVTMTNVDNRGMNLDYLALLPT